MEPMPIERIKRYTVFVLASFVIIVGLLVAGKQTIALQMTATPIPQGTVIGATSSVPTSTSAPTTGNLLPSGTLILSQKNQLIALPPSGKPISLAPERFGAQAAGNGKVGLQFTVANDTTNLVLVDNSTGSQKPLPLTGLHNPTITWKNDGSGFAFFEFNPAVGAANGPNVGAIRYYDVAANKVSTLVAAPGVGQAATSIAWSPDGRYLLYSVGNAGAEGTGGPDSKAFLFDSTSGKSIALSQEASGFNQWDRASKGFLAQRGDIASGASQLLYFSLDALNTPKALTPANTLDFLADISPDGKRIVVTSSPAAKGVQVANLYMLNLDGSSRKALTAFKASDQAITALVWGADGIYYSLSGATGDTTWRIDLDGKNPRQVAIGTLVDIIGSH